MRTFLKTSLARAVATCGGLRWLHAGRLVVLTFHRVRPDGEPDGARPMRNLEVDVSDFRRLLTWMRAHYEPLALGDWLARAAPPARPVFAITFDDGWADNFEYAFPVLRELDLPATIFLATGAVENRTPFWWQVSDLTDGEIERLKNQSQDQLEARVAADPVARKTHADDFLSWDSIREMGRSGRITFGPHGHRHALLTALSRAEALADIRHCWELLQQHVPEAIVPMLAWPNGNARADLAAGLEALGLRAAVGTGRGAVSFSGANRWCLPRNNVDRNTAREPGLLPWLLLRAQ